MLAAVLAGAALAAAVAGGAQWHRADRAFAQSVRVGSPAGIEKAAALWSWEPFYSLEAGAQPWRQGLAAQDAAAVARGHALEANYSNPWTITQPAGTNWWVRVYYFSTGGTQIAVDNSNAAFTITAPPLTVTSPNGGESWAGGSTHNVTWTVSPAATSGYFRVLYYNPTSGVYQYASPDVPVVSGQANYSNPWTITQPVGTNWWVRVYYFSTGGTQIAVDNSNAAFTITAL